MNNRTRHHLAILWTAVMLWAGIPSAFAAPDIPLAGEEAPQVAQIAESNVEENTEGTKEAEKAADEDQDAEKQITGVDARQVESDVEVTIQGSGGLNYTAFKLMDPLRLVLDFQDMGPGSLKDPIQVGQGVVDSIRPMYFDEAGVQRLEIDLNATASYEIQKPEENRVVIRLHEVETQTAQATPEMSADETPAASAPAETMRVGPAADPCDEILSSRTQKVSVEFQNADLKNVFRLFSEVGGVNLVLSPQVNGTTNVKIENVSWFTALDIILDNNKLGTKCKNNIVRVAPKAELVAERIGQDQHTQMVRLNYADIKDAISNLNSIKSPTGKVVPDVRTNTLILTDTKQILDDMLRVVKNLDKPTRQVQIESRIIQINRDFLQELGIQWGVQSTTIRTPQFPGAIQIGGAAVGDGALSAATAGAGGNTFGGTSPLGATPSVASALTDVRIDPGWIVDLATSSNPFGAIATTLLSRDGDLAINLQLSALERQGKSKTIASPKVTTLDNKEALIKSGTRLPFQTTDPTSGTKIEFIDAVIELKVTPHVTSEDWVNMAIEARQNTPDPVRNVGGTPVILTREAFTELLVTDRDTAVLGGLFQKRISTNDRAVPYVSEIPIIGNLFKSTQDSDAISELLIFIKPTIIKGIEG